MLNLLILVAALWQPVEPVHQPTLTAAADSTFVLPTLHLALLKGATPLAGALDEGSTPSPITFLPERLTFMVTVLAKHDDRFGVRDGVKTIRLTDDWWKGITLTWERLPVPSYPATGEPFRVTSDDFTDVVTAAVDARGEMLKHPTALRVYEKAWARFRVPPPPAGNYVIKATVDSAMAGGVEIFPNNQEIVAVRTGRENRVLYRMYLHEASKGKPFKEYKQIILELTQLEPDNATLWESLASTSIGRVSHEETLQYYDRAYEVFSRNVERSKQPLSQEDRSYATFLTLYRRLYPLFVARADAITLKPFVDDGVKTFVVIDRATGKKLGKVDPSHPELPPPLMK